MDDFLLKHVLVVDDEEAYRDMVEHVVLKSGRTCDIAKDASEALDKLCPKYSATQLSDHLPTRHSRMLYHENRFSFRRTGE